MIPRIAELIAMEEGYGIPGALPTRNNNPGDLRHSPHSFHTAAAPNAIGQIDTPTDGWNDLVEQLDDYVARRLTVAQAIEDFAPPTENDTQGYLAYILTGLGCTGSTLLADVMDVPGIGAYADEPT
jgi:hypothetical protein